MHMRNQNWACSDPKDSELHKCCINYGRRTSCCQHWCLRILIPSSDFRHKCCIGVSAIMPPHPGMEWIFIKAADSHFIYSGSSLGSTPQHEQKPDTPTLSPQIWNVDLHWDCNISCFLVIDTYLHPGRYLYQIPWIIFSLLYPTAGFPCGSAGK